MKAEVDATARIRGICAYAIVLAACASFEHRGDTGRDQAAMTPQLASEDTTPLAAPRDRAPRILAAVPSAVVHDASTVESPPEAPASATASPGLAPGVVNRIVRGSGGGVGACYADGLKRYPLLAGRVVVEITIGRDGSVLLARAQSSTLRVGSFRQCVVNAVQGMSFPEPGGVIRVLYDFTFGGDARAPTRLRRGETSPGGAPGRTCHH